MKIINNVLIVKTKETNGRAWAAWVVKKENASGLKYVVSLNKPTITVYKVKDFVADCFTPEDNYKNKRVLFDLEECDGESIIANLKTQGIDFFGTPWTLKFANI